MTRTIYLNSSEVAAAIGVNPYRTAQDVATAILQSQFARPAPEPIHFAEALRTATPSAILQQRIAEQAVAALETPGSRDALDAVARAALATNRPAETKQLSEDVRRAVETRIVAAVAAEAPSNPDDVVRAVLGVTQASVDAAVERAVNLTTGRLGEKAIVDEVEVAAQVPVVQRNCVLRYRTVPIPARSPLETAPIQHHWRITIGGKPDGLIAAGASTAGHVAPPLRVVEVKQRQRRLFRRVPEYEMVQVQLYMWIFGAQSCEFRERFRDESWTTTVLADPTMVDTILTKLFAFATDCVIPHAQNLRPTDRRAPPSKRVQ